MPHDLSQQCPNIKYNIIFRPIMEAPLRIICIDFFSSTEDFCRSRTCYNEKKMPNQLQGIFICPKVDRFLIFIQTSTGSQYFKIRENKSNLSNPAQDFLLFTNGKMYSIIFISNDPTIFYTTATA